MQNTETRLMFSGTGIDVEKENVIELGPEYVEKYVEIVVIAIIGTAVF